MIPVLLTSAARADVIDAHDWYKAIMPDLGLDFQNEVDAAIGKITTNPNMYAVVHRDIRRILLHRFPFGLFYRVEVEAVYIIACFHCSRDPEIWKKRK